MIVPQGADNYEHAAMCESAGAAITLRPEVLDAANLAAAVLRVVDDGSYARSSRTCTGEIAAMPDADFVAAALRSWVSDD